MTQPIVVDQHDELKKQLEQMMTCWHQSGFYIETLMVTHLENNTRQISSYGKDKISYAGDDLGLTYEIEVFPPDGGFDPRHSICIKMTDKHGDSELAWGWATPNEYCVIVKQTKHYDVELHLRGNQQ